MCLLSSSILLQHRHVLNVFKGVAKIEQMNLISYALLVPRISNLRKVVCAKYITQTLTS